MLPEQIFFYRHEFTEPKPKPELPPLECIDPGFQELPLSEETARANAMRVLHHCGEGATTERFAPEVITSRIPGIDWFCRPTRCKYWFVGVKFQALDWIGELWVLLHRRTGKLVRAKLLFVVGSRDSLNHDQAQVFERALAFRMGHPYRS